MKKLTINNRELTFSLGLGLIGELLEELDLETNVFFSKVSKNPYKYYPIIMYFSAKLYNEQNGIETDFTLKDIISDLEQYNYLGVDDNPILEFGKIFWDSVNKNVPVEESEEAETEKKK